MDTKSARAKRPDLEFRPSEVFKGAGVVLDFFITYPGKSTAHNSLVAGVAAGTREKEKMKKYDQAAEKENKVFIPVVLETHGYWSSTVDKLLNTLLKAVADRSRLPYSSLRHYFYFL